MDNIIEAQARKEINRRSKSFNREKGLNTFALN